MTVLSVITAAVAVAFLALALVALRRAAKPLAVPLGLMCVAMFGYTLLDVLGAWTGAVVFDGLAYVAAALLAVPTFEVVVGFVGRKRRLIVCRVVVAVYFVVLAALTAVAVAVGRHDLPGNDLWSVIMLAGLVPAFGFGGWLLALHAGDSGPEERARAQLLGGAVLLGVGGSAADLVLIAAGSDLRVAALAQLASALLVTGLVVRAKLFEDVSKLTIANAAIVAAVAVLAQVGLLSWVGTEPALFVVGTSVIALALLFAVRPVWVAAMREHERREQLATLGRFAEQMAHDLRNPLAAIRGAAQFLEQEHRDGRSLDPQVEFVTMILERTDHLTRVLDDYRRMARVEPVRARTDLVRLVDAVAQAQRLAAPEGVTIAVDAQPASALVDPDLLTTALENLLRNAFEAMEGGTIAVRLRQVDGIVDIEVEDDGPGMDARTCERVFDAFYTTKATGSGLGLAFVRRVLEAHGGSARLDSRLGRGTRVVMSLPTA